MCFIHRVRLNYIKNKTSKYTITPVYSVSSMLQGGQFSGSNCPKGEVVMGQFSVGQLSRGQLSYVSFMHAFSFEMKYTYSWILNIPVSTDFIVLHVGQICQLKGGSVVFENHRELQ